MSEVVEPFAVTCPANTPNTAPIEVLCTLPPCEVESIALRVPSGHASLTGIRFAYGHTTVIPYTSGGWIIGDATERTYTVEGAGNSGAWSVFVYNSDVQAHYWLVEFFVNAVTVKIPRGMLRYDRRAPLPDLHAVAIGSQVPIIQPAGNGPQTVARWVPGAGGGIEPQGAP